MYDGKQGILRPAGIGAGRCKFVGKGTEKMEQIDYKFIDQVLADHACDASQIIAIMQDVQGKYRYLPKDALRYIADKVGISESKIYGVATFYENFSLEIGRASCRERV